MKAMVQRWSTPAAAAGYSLDAIETLWNMLVLFPDDGFNKANSAKPMAFVVTGPLNSSSPIRPRHGGTAH